MRHFFYLRSLQGFTIFALTKDHPGKQFEPQLEFIIWKPSGRGNKGGCQQIKLKIGFFSLIILKPKQHLKLFGSFVAKTWQHFHSVTGSTEPISSARTLLSFPTYPTPCGAQACGPQ